MRQTDLIAAAALALLACGGAKVQTSPAAASEPAAVKSAEASFDVSETPAGLYESDPRHAYILFSYDHQGYSRPQIRWREWSADLNWNPADPERSSVTVVIDATKPDSGVDVFDGHLRGEAFFDAAKYPEIRFASTSLTVTGPNTASMKGDLTIKNITKPVTLDVTINRAASNAEAYKLGFSARGIVKRSDFGVDKYVPVVGDEVALVIETEFVMPREAASAAQ